MLPTVPVQTTCDFPISTDGCYHGKCDNITNICVCDEGYTNDVSLFWVNDCNMPTYFMNLIGAVAIVLAVAIMGLGAYFHVRKPLRGTLRKALICVMWSQVGMVAGGIALIAEQATTPWFWMMMGFAMLALTWGGGIMVKEFLEVAAYAIFHERDNEHSSKLRLLWPLFPILGGGPFFIGAFIGFGLRSNAAEYNNLIISTLLCMPILQLVATPVLWISSSTLISIVQKHVGEVGTPRNGATTGSSEHLGKTLDNLKGFRSTAMANMISFVICVLGLAIAYFVLGHRIPFVYIIMLLLTSSVSLTSINFFVFLRKPSQKASSSTKGDTTNSAPTAPGDNTFSNKATNGEGSAVSVVHVQDA